MNERELGRLRHQHAVRLLGRTGGVIHRVNMRAMGTELRGPDVLGIGAQRAGTTWLHRNLNKHPHVSLVPAPLKEVHFFDELHLAGSENRHRKRVRKLTKLAARLEERGIAGPEELATIEHLKVAERDDDWYRRLFTLVPAQNMRGEVTPAYGLLPDAGIQHILRLSPDVRLILMLRHPVDRAWSHVRYVIGRRLRGIADERDVDTSPDALRALAYSEDNRQRTDYPSIIQRFSVVPPDQLHINFFDRVITEPRSVLGEIATFLDLDPGLFREEQLRMREKLNDSPRIALPPALGAELAATYRADVQWLIKNVPGVPVTWPDKVDSYAAATAG